MMGVEVEVDTMEEAAVGRMAEGVDLAGHPDQYLSMIKVFKAGMVS